MDKKTNRKAADNIRILSAAMVEKAKSGHPGGAMGGADFIHILYSEFLRFDPSDGAWRNRDRFFLDPGHMSPMLYSVLSLYNYFSLEELKQFRQWNSPTPGHPEKDFSRGVENTSGPLGQGHTFAVGAAIAAKYLEKKFGKWQSHDIYAYISDGGIQEEISQGAGRMAGTLGLGNLVMFYDSNGIQLSSETSVVTDEDTAAKYRSWNWEVLEINASDHEEIRQALRTARSVTDKPVLIIGKTVIGKGALDADGNSFENNCEVHGMPLSKAGASFEKTVENLGGNPEEPFLVFPSVRRAADKVIEKKILAAQRLKEKEKAWRESHPEQAARYDLFYSGNVPGIDYARLPQKENIATRASAGNTLKALAGRVENLIVASADLSNSDKTDGFLSETKAFRKGDFSGSFLQAGVSELTMAAVAVGMSLHGGVIPAVGTFFVFSDYMKPVVRIAALMEVPVKFIWTHDAFRVGEDGPTHQPVEQEAQIRLLEQLKNHKGENSLLVLRPADSSEATVSWKMALENKNTPTALILSRQNILSLPAPEGDRFREAGKSLKGAYVVYEPQGKPQVILVANGSEVSTLIAGAELLRERRKIRARVVSAISEGLFRRQTEAYQESVLLPGVPRFGLTAGLPVTLRGLVGEKGSVWGLSSFGYSAPAEVLDKKLGFTGEKVFEEVLKLLGKK